MTTETNQKDLYKRMQTKTFTNWINAKLRVYKMKVVSNLFEEVRDGIPLYNLLVALGKNPPEISKLVAHKIVKMENLSMLLKYISQDLGLILVNIGPEDIYEKNEKLILGLIWTIILHLSISDGHSTSNSNANSDGHSSELRSTVLTWVKMIVSHSFQVKITNFTTSFSDGVIFLMLLDHFYPGVYNQKTDTPENKRNNLEKAFAFAESIGINRLLDIEDLIRLDELDDKSVFTYLLEFYLFFKDNKINGSSKDYLKELLLNINTKKEKEVEHQNAVNTVQMTTKEYLATVHDLNDNLNKVAKEIDQFMKQYQELSKTRILANQAECDLQSFIYRWNLQRNTKEYNEEATKEEETILDKKIGDLNLNSIRALTSTLIKCDKKYLDNSTQNKIHQQKNESKAEMVFTKKSCKDVIDQLKLVEIDVVKIVGKPLTHLPTKMSIEDLLNNIKE
ncbi:DYST [Enterospora canceri]|uniref:DYST n=1 Tax=Enterospora canceri TaxID=1081671 RepID=A0A1Y1S9W7_9MICR|nr:DYST [Enterospora canceri]